jgi:hypothetical protein
VVAVAEQSSTITQIKAELAAATPGPWKVNRDGPDDMAWVMGQYDELADAHAEVTDYLLFADATLIASARNHLAALLDVAEAAQRQHTLKYVDAEAGHVWCSCSKRIPNCPVLLALQKLPQVNAKEEDP